MDRGGRPHDFLEQKLLSFFRSRFFRPRDLTFLYFGALFGHFWIIFHDLSSLGSLFEPCRSSIVVIYQITNFLLRFTGGIWFQCVVHVDKIS